MVDFDSLYEEVVSHYLGKDFYPDVKGLEKYKTTQMEATALDEYIALLSEGYINVELCEDLDEYFIELLENEWFHQWPLVRWAFASRLLRGNGTRKSAKRAINILLPMAKEGQPGAMYDIGYCYRFSGFTLKHDYERAICLWLEASKKGYRVASEELNKEYDLRIFYKDLNDELKLFFLSELYMIYLRDYKGDPATIMENLNEQEQKRFKKIADEGKMLQKAVSAKTYLRTTTNLAWTDEDNPYKINF